MLLVVGLGFGVDDDVVDVDLTDLAVVLEDAVHGLYGRLPEHYTIQTAWLGIGRNRIIPERRCVLGVLVRPEFDGTHYVDPFF